MITHPKGSPTETVCQLLPPTSQFCQRPVHAFVFLFSKLPHNLLLKPLLLNQAVCFCCLLQMTLIDMPQRQTANSALGRAYTAYSSPNPNFPGLKMLRSTRHLLYFMEAQELGLVCIFTAFISILPSVKCQWGVFSQSFPGEVMIFPKPLRQNLLILFDRGNTISWIFISCFQHRICWANEH